VRRIHPSTGTEYVIIAFRSLKVGKITNHYYTEKLEQKGLQIYICSCRKQRTGFLEPSTIYRVKYDPV